MNQKAIDLNSNSFEWRAKKKDGEAFWVQVYLQKTQIGGKDRITTSVRDITARKQAEDKVKALLTEKELLLREVHHRVKNNMTTVMGLLSLQSSTLKGNSSAVVALQDARTRVQGMMVLYDKLYRSSNFREISMKEYIASLIDEVIDNFHNRKSVTIERQIDDIILDAKMLSPVGIIMNELLTNAMKYAFKGRENGKIFVSLSFKGNQATLVVQDDGIGIPESIDIATSTGFGMQLIGMLTEQLEGTIRIEREQGAKFVLEFEV